MNQFELTKQQRRGVSVVEFAVVLPVIVLLLAGAIEAARGVMVSHTLQEAAQAGCRVYSVEGTSRADAEAIIETALSQAGISTYAISFSPSNKESVDIPMEPVTVTITADYSNVAWLPPNFLAGATLRGRCVMPADIDISDGGDSNGYASNDDDNPDDGYERYGSWNPGGSWYDYGWGWGWGY